MMFSITTPFRCYDCKEDNLVIPDGAGQSVKLKCECIVGWCQVSILPTAVVYINCNIYYMYFFSVIRRAQENLC